MQTRKALAKLTKGEAQGDRTDSPLLKKSEQYLDMYNRTEESIVQKKSANELNLPFVQSLRNKVAHTLDMADANLPVVAAFDLYTGIKKMHQRSLKDAGLKKLAAHMERIWSNDPVGTLTYGQVQSLIKIYKDQFPKSAAADAIEAECTRVGLHKLPVAKLARLANKIDSQESYDAIVEAEGLAGSRPEQVRSRAFLRSLVSMKSAEVDARLPSKRASVSSASEHVGDRLSALSKTADYDKALDLLAESVQLSDMLEKTLDSAAAELHTDGISGAGAKLDALSVALGKWREQLTRAQAGAAPGPDPIVKQKPEPAPAPELTPEEEAGVGRKWYDPRTWWHSKASELVSIAREASLHADDALASAIDEFTYRLAQMMNEMEELDTGSQPELADDMAPMPNDMAPSQPPPVLDQGVDVMRDIEQAADEIVMDAPPEAMDYIQHEMSEGHSAPPGTAEWGAEEILNEGHTAPPPSEGWLQEEMAEMGKQGQKYKQLNRDPRTSPFEHSIDIADTGASDVPPGMGNDIEPYLGDDEAGVDFDNIGDLLDSAPDPLFDGLDVDASSDKDAQSYKDLNRKPVQPFFEHGIDIADTGAGDVPPGMGNDIEPYLGDDEFGVDFSNVDDLADSAPDPLFDGLDVDATREAKRGKGIPVPGKPKSQPKVTTYAKHPSSGGKVLKASVVEDALLSGERVRVADSVIFINDNNEVELWSKGAGKACSLENLDVAIRDFIASIDANVSARKASKAANAFRYSISEIVSVPCEMCGTISVFPKAAATDDYGCTCGHVVKNASFEEVRNIVSGDRRAYRIAIKYDVGTVPAVSTAKRNKLLASVKSMSAGSFKLEHCGNGSIVGTIWDTDKASMTKMSNQLKAIGGSVGIARSAQGIPSAEPSAPAAPAAPMAPMAPAPSAPPTSDDPALPSMPIGDLANAAFTNYKAQGLSLPEAMQAFLREHKERLQEWNPSEDGSLMGAISAQYTNALAPAAPAAPAMPMMALSKDAQEKMKTPKPKKQTDKVKLPGKPLGKDTSGDSGVPSPGSIKSQHKPSGKMSPKDLGKDSEAKDLLPSPSEKPRSHIEAPSGSSFSDKDLGEDSEPNDDMKVPSMGAKPSVKK